MSKPKQPEQPEQLKSENFSLEQIPGPFTPRNILKELKELLIIAAIVLVIIGHLVQGSMVIGGSMEPTFNSEESSLPLPLSKIPDMVIVNKLAWYFQSWDYGDVVILYSPEEPKKKLIKRLLGKAGDQITIRINNAGDMETFEVGAGEVMVVGDNLDNSNDSRSFGPVPLALLQGKVWMQIWPFFPKFISSKIPHKKQDFQLIKAPENIKEEEQE